MTSPICDRGRPRGFTLVELITVIAILGILVTLTVGAVQGVRNYVARKATEEIFAALDAALQRYCAEWGKFPDVVAIAGQSDYGLVNAVDNVCAPLGTVTSTQAASFQRARDAMLYAVLTMTERGGPYYRGSVSQAKMLNEPTTLTPYRVFVDGWKREILYLTPGTANLRARISLRGGALNWYYPGQAINAPVPSQPVLESLGADEAADDDNMVNYGYIQ